MSLTVRDFVAPLAPHRVSGDLARVLTGLHYDSRTVAAGGLFFALRGQKADGHRFIGDAVARGAAAVVMEEETPLPAGVAGLLVADARRALAAAARLWYGDPSRDIPVVGVTGTNGKTTSTYLLEAILTAAGRHPAVIGTINARYGATVRPALHTTPEAPELLGTLAEFRRAGCDALVMEVSSHALSQFRVDGMRFAVGLFTNLTPEHLDYHGEMDAYFASKERFFRELLPAGGGRAAVNLDDPYGRQLAATLPGALGFGHGEDAAVRPGTISLGLSGIRGEILTPAGPVSIDSALVGPFNLSNLLGAVAAATLLGIGPEAIAAGLARAPQVPGRMERIENDRGALVLVDYAHTADALEKVLSAARELRPRRLLTLFGCGGDRDPRKRPEMGRVAASLSDLVIVTSDNPRTEDPLAIIAAIRPGVTAVLGPALAPAALAERGAGWCEIPDRRAAIEQAVACLRRDDILVVAGKGHEDYQIIGSVRHHFDDREELRRALGGGRPT